MLSAIRKAGFTSFFVLITLQRYEMFLENMFYNIKNLPFHALIYPKYTDYVIYRWQRWGIIGIFISMFHLLN